MKALCESSSQVRRHFTRFDQVEQLVRASEADPDMGFMARLLALCSLPRTNPGRRLQYKRVNGPYTLIITAVGQIGLPFGNLPRLLLAWVSTEAVRTGKRELFLGSSLSEFMRKLGVAPIGGGSRGERTRLRNQMSRLFNAHIQLAYEDKNVDATVNAVIADRTVFWWNERKPGESSLWQSEIELGEAFFNEIINHPVPIDMNTLKALKRSALGLDLYLWLTYRTFMLKRPMRLSWSCLYRQFGINSAQAGDKRAVDNFRTDCLRELKKIKVAWPDLNYTVAQGVLVLWPSKPAIAPQAAPSTRGVGLPGPRNAPPGGFRKPERPPPLGIRDESLLRDSESVFHKTPVIRGSFPGMKHQDTKHRNLDETPRQLPDSLDETPRHSCS